MFIQKLCNIQNILPNKILALDEAEIGHSIDAIMSQWPDISDAPSWKVKHCYGNRNEKIQMVCQPHLLKP